MHTWECAVANSQTERGLQTKRWYMVAALQEKASHFSCAKTQTTLSCNGIVRMQCNAHTRTHIAQCQPLCATYRLARPTALWNIFHVDIATHKLHIIHRDIISCLCASASVVTMSCTNDIFTEMLKCLNATHSHWTMMLAWLPGFYHLRHCGRICNVSLSLCLSRSSSNSCNIQVYLRMM